MCFCVKSRCGLDIEALPELNVDAGTVVFVKMQFHFCDSCSSVLTVQFLCKNCYITTVVTVICQEVHFVFMHWITCS